ncbi:MULTISPECIES: GntR family transcriptional regulator [Thermomonosporaceae]|uniref:GntR family transcriptional regulator n=1 Tax=Thermomonosporaceae TaxID=2012 RepID=UPI00255AE85D|nr:MULTISPECIES: GntR family transcriptional regulator [Thermomonosporaceae]MDL4775973.1 GntR family transcriptional regulator [Actinomadura xylanilytica]
MTEFLYERIAAVLREQILSGALSPGDRLPTQDALSTRYKVSRVVARQVVELLETEGLVDRGKGAGTFVREYRPLIRRSTLHYRPDPGTPYAEESVRAERVPRYTHHSHEDGAGTEIARRLDVEPGDAVMVTEYVSYSDDEPTMIVTSYEPLEITRGTPIEHPEEGPLHGAGVVDRFTSIGRRPVRVVERLRSRMPRPTEARRLHLRPGVPVIVIVRTTRTADGPVETADLVLAADQFELEYPIQVGGHPAPDGRPGESEHAGA